MKKTPKKTLPIGALSIVLIAGIFFALQATHTTHFFRANTVRKQKQEEKQYNNKQKEAVINGKGNPSTTDASGQPVTSGGTYTPPNNSDNITITPSQQGDQVVVTTKLAGYSDGSCTLTVTDGSKTNKQSAQVVYAPDFSTCAGFTVPISSLGKGTWSISLAVISGGITTTKSTTLTVQ